jgi:hypothetical protein
MFVLHAGMVVQAVFALRWMPFSRVRRMPVSCVRLSKAPTVAIDVNNAFIRKSTTNYTLDSVKGSPYTLSSDGKSPTACASVLYQCYVGTLLRSLFMMLSRIVSSRLVTGSPCSQSGSTKSYP